jgi:hypothetical protein
LSHEFDEIEEAFDMRTVPAIAAAALLFIVSPPAAGAEASASFDITGGEAWEDRTGFGMMIGLGGVDCTKDFCDDIWDTKLFGSFAGTLGAFYRLIPNLSVFLDFGVAHMNTDFNEVSEADDGKGLLFHFAGGAAFHAPITGWMDAQLGVGIGFAFMRFRTDISMAGPADAAEVRSDHRGLNFEIRSAVDIYLFSAAPNFAVGPYFKLGIPYWAKVCYYSEAPDVFTAGDEFCGKPDEIEKDMPTGRTWHFDETPFLIHLGLAAKYTF